MSLVGSLEDLGLGDILQIISLSGKSGELLLRSGDGEGRILFDQGRIRTAYIGSGSPSSDELLESLAPGKTPSPDHRETLLREHIERCVFRMFSWASGEFSFEVGDVACIPASQLFLECGINPQFLALEGTRIADEQAAGLDRPEPVLPAGLDHREPTLPAGAVVVADPADEICEPGSGIDPLADVELEEDPEPLDEEQGGRLGVELVSEPLAHEPDAPDGLSDPIPAGTLAPPLEPVPIEPAAVLPDVEPAAVLPEVRPAGALPPLVLIDPDLPVVEWVRSALPGDFPAAHLFQSVDQGVGRIRQYLRRATAPLVVLSCSVPADPISGAAGPVDLMRRLRRQAPHMRLLLLEEVGRPVPKELERLGFHHSRLTKPTPTQLADPRLGESRERLGQELARDLMAAVRPQGEPPAPVAEAGPAVQELREVSARLRASASGGEVLPQMIEFATRIFSRVALFMIRDEEAQGIAQMGLPKAGGPDDEGIREVCLHTSESTWLQKVIEHRAPIRPVVGPEPPESGDGKLIASLGDAAPREAWLGPIEIANQVVAVLYADMLPGQEAIADTAALEVVLHHAGLALDRAALERALEEPGA